MTTITDIKQVYPEFKLIKDYYTTLNKSENVVFSSDGKTLVAYYTTDTFYIMSISISATSEFIKWLNGKFINIEMSQLQTIKKVLKKNAKSIEYTEDSFTFKFLSEDQEESISVSPLEEFDINKFLKIKPTLGESVEFPAEYLDSEILQLFNNGLSILNYKDNNYTKLLEIPSKRLNALQKEAKYYVQFSERNQDGYRYVAIKSVSNSVEIEQIFLTI